MLTLKLCVQKSLLDVLNEQGLSETHLMAETWTQLEGALPHVFTSCLHMFGVRVSFLLEVFGVPSSRLHSRL